jgi:hypothetical protein
MHHARRTLSVLSLVVFASVSLPSGTHAATATLRPSKDNTIYSDSNLSDGAGAFLFAGSSGQRRVLRSLIAFDVSSIPAGSTINAVTLTLAINTPLSRNANTVNVHRLLADWGEGTSNATSGGGGGATATNGDATWNFRFFNTASWSTPGGDFAGTVSASQPVSGSSGNATFSGAAMAADVQAWVNNGATNFGWMLKAQDENGAAVRFASRQGAPVPTLLIDYTPGGGGGNTAPVFTTQPVGQVVAAGGSVTFTAAATGTPAPAYQWRKDDVALTGATNATLTLTNVTSANAGSYTVVATNAAGSVTSTPAILTVTGGNTGTSRLSNLSVRAAMTAGQTLIVGFSVSGGARSILMRGVGPTLTSLGVGGAMSDPRLELYNDTTLVAQNEDWGNSSALSDAFASVGAFAFLANSKDAAMLQPIDGTRSVQLKGTGPGVALVELYDTGSGNTPRLVNVSARNQVGTGDNILIFGFFINGTGTKNVLIRAVGPRLADFGVSGVLDNPRLDVFRSGSSTPMIGNDDWDASLAPTFTAVGAFSLVNGSKDAATIVSLSPGGYTVQVSGVGGGTGEALVEIYEVP